jgi:membrane associated rhomboid family serine protease
VTHDDDGDAAAAQGHAGRIFQAPAIVPVSAAILIAIHGLLQMAGEDWQILSLYALSFIPARIGGGETFPAPPGAAVWSFVTYALLHGSWLHVIFNSIWLLIFGSAVASRLGSLGYLAVAAAGSIAGAALTLALHWGEPTVMIGASGSVSGLLAAAVPIMYAPGMRWGNAFGEKARSITPLSPSEFARNRGAMIFTLVWIVITLYSGATGWTGAGYADGFRIAWEAHLGGFAGGLAAFYFLEARCRT